MRNTAQPHVISGRFQRFSSHLCLKQSPTDDFNGVDESSNRHNFFHQLRKKAIDIVAVTLISVTLGSKSVVAQSTSSETGGEKSAVEVVAFWSKPVDSKTKAAELEALRQAELARQAEIELIIEKQRSDQLTRTGLAIAGFSLVASLLLGDGGKKPTASKKSNKITVTKLPDSRTYQSTTTQDKRTTPVTKKDVPLIVPDQDVDDIPPPVSLVKPPVAVTRSSKLPPMEELFPEGDDLFADPPPTPSKPLPLRRKEAVTTPSPSSTPEVPVTPFTETTTPTLSNQMPDMNILSTIETVQPTSQPLEPLAPPPIVIPTPKKNSNIIDRIFKKSSSSRPTNLPDVMQITDAATEFRSVS